MVPSVGKLLRIGAAAAEGAPAMVSAHAANTALAINGRAHFLCAIGEGVFICRAPGFFDEVSGQFSGIAAELLFFTRTYRTGRDIQGLACLEGSPANYRHHIQD
jgi:hypothetical protein